MESFLYNRHIPWYKSVGKSCKEGREYMSNLKKAFVPVIGAVMLAFTPMREAFAQTSTPEKSNDISYAKNEAKPAPGFTSKPETTNDTLKAENPLIPAIREGDYGQALAHSGKNNLMTVHISGSSLTQLTKQAQELHDKFKSGTVPTDIVIFYKVNGKVPQTMGAIVMNGEGFELKSGTSVFDFETLKKYTDTFIKYYNKQYGQASASTNAGTNAPEHNP